MPDLNPHIEVIPEWIRAGIRVQVPVAELPSVFGPTFTRVAEAITSAGSDIIGPAYACYFGDPSEVIDVEIGFGIDAFMSSDQVQITTAPATDAVVATHIGTPEQLAASYELLVPWIVSSGVDIANYMYEFYDTMDEANPSQATTRMVFPLL